MPQVDHTSKITGKCPYCILNKDDNEQVWVQRVGLYQCSHCGKHWREDALGKEYSLKLEQDLFGEKSVDGKIGA